MYDVSDPTQPTALTPQPTVMPVSTTLSVEPRAGTLALVDLNSHHLLLYDVSGEQAVLHAGEPIDLLTEFPEDGGQNAFQVRNMRFDPIRGRLFLARAQGIASEVIAYAYPPVEPKLPDATEEDCAAGFSYADLRHIPDDIDVAVPIEERAHLLSSFMALPMIGEEFILFIASAWRNTSMATLVSLMSDDGQRMNQLPACSDYEGNACFYTSYFNGNPSPYNHLTDGTGCVDQRFGIFAGVGLEDDEQSSLFLFKINRAEGLMEPLLSETGRNLSTSIYPLVLACH